MTERSLPSEPGNSIACRDLTRRLAEREAEVARLGSELAAIHGSRLWRIGHAYWSLLRRFRLGSGGGCAAAPALASVPEPAPSRDVAAPGEGKYDVLCFPALDPECDFQRPPLLMLQFARHGHRVFYLAQSFREEGEPYCLRQVAVNIYEVSLRGAGRTVCAETLGEDDRCRLLDALDALRRDISLQATVAVVQQPLWGPLVEETWRRFAWPIVYDRMDHHVGLSADLSETQEQEDRLLALAPRVREIFPRVSIVIVTYNNLEINRMCLESLYARTEWPHFEVIAIDNGSTDGTAEYLAEIQKKFLSLSVVLNGLNAGFAAAVNQGLRRADGEYLVLLNNDTVLSRGWLTALLRHLHVRPEIGLIGPVSNAIGNRAKVEVGYERVEDMPEWAACYVREHDGELVPSPMVAMFCLAMRREVFERVGPLDERFGLGMFEDDDYNRRVRALGYEIVFARDTFVHHWQRASFRLLGEPEYYRIFNENRRLYEAKWGEPWNPEEVEVDPRAQASLPGEILDRVRASRRAVIFLPSVGWRIHLFQRPHHLARSFAGLGYLVIFACADGQDTAEGFQEIEPNLFLFRGEQAILHRIPDPIVWSFPYNFHLAREFPLDAVTVYDWIDDLAVFPYDRAFLERNHRWALEEATIVASVSRRLDAKAREVRADALYLPNGVEYERFAGEDTPAPESLPNDPKLARLLSKGRPIAGYYGALAEWLDYDLLDEVARRRPDWSFLLIGPMHDGSLRGRSVLERPNVVWTGPRDYASLSGYLRWFDVAMIPFRINDITLATSPLKLYEYLAGGKPVIATPMPECQALPEVRIASDAEELSRALDTALEEGRDGRFRARLRAIGRESSWLTRIEAVLDRIEEVSREGLSKEVTRGCRDHSLPMANAEDYGDGPEVERIAAILAGEGDRPFAIGEPER